MPNENRCPKCGASERIPDVTVLTRVAGADGDLMAEVKCHPDALFWQGAIYSPLRATICAKCGFTELYATDARDLLSAYRKRQSSG